MRLTIGPEVGLPREHARVHTTLPPVMSKHGLKVVPVLASLASPGACRDG
jgi:hypothetical protein